MEVVVGTGTNPSSLSTWTGTGVPEKDITNLIAWPLIMWDENLEFEMVLAKDMHFPDDLTIVFELHEGLLFHDGVEMTAEDVKYTFDTMSDPDAREGRGYINQSFYRPIEEIVVTDRYTVEFRLNTPHAPLLYYLAEGIMPKHIGEEHGDTYLEQNPIGVAPFKLETWVPQEYISIIACDNFYLGRPKIDRIVFRQIEDMHTRVIELETGGVHAISGIAHEHVQGLVDNPDITVEMKPGTGYTYLLYNQRRPPFDDPRVRQALNYATDAVLLTEIIWYNRADEMHSPIIPVSWAYCDNVTKYYHNREKARELLEAAGFTPENPLEASLEFSTSETWRNVGEILMEEWADLGVNITVHEHEWGLWLDKSRAGDWDMLLWGISGQSDPDRGITRQFHTRGGQATDGSNFQGYANPQIDALIEAANKTFDMDERFELFCEIQQTVTEQAIFNFICSPNVLAAHSNRLKNFSYTGYFYYMDLWDAWLE